jgi:hypothetical protein
VKLLYEWKVQRLHGSDKCDAQLVVQMFSLSDKAKLALGNLHLRTPTKTTITRATRKRLVAEAARILDSTAQRESGDEHDDAFQHVARLLVGDCNLRQAEGEEAVQPLQPDDARWDNVWHVHSTLAARGGDILFVKGANSDFFELPVGASHADRGVRNDDHDSFGVQLRLPARVAARHKRRVHWAEGAEADGAA